MSLVQLNVWLLDTLNTVLFFSFGLITHIYALTANQWSLSPTGKLHCHLRMFTEVRQRMNSPSSYEEMEGNKAFVFSFVLFFISLYAFVCAVGALAKSSGHCHITQVSLKLWSAFKTRNPRDHSLYRGHWTNDPGWSAHSLLPLVTETSPMLPLICRTLAGCGPWGGCLYPYTELSLMHSGQTHAQPWGSASDAKHSSSKNLRVGIEWSEGARPDWCIFLVLRAHVWMYSTNHMNQEKFLHR